MARDVVRITEEDLKRAADTAPEWEVEHAARMARDSRDRRFLDVDASDWRNMADFYEAAFPLLGIAELADQSPGALVAAMVRGRTDAVRPSYTLRVSSVAALSTCLTASLRRVQERVCDARTRSLVGGWPTFAVHVDLRPYRGMRAISNGRLVIEIDASGWGRAAISTMPSCPSSARLTGTATARLRRSNRSSGARSTPSNRPTCCASAT